MHETAAATPRQRRPDHLRQGYGDPPKLHAKAEASQLLRTFGQPCWALILGIVLLPAPLFAIITISVEGVAGSKPIKGINPVFFMDFGTVSAFEALPAGVNRTIGASDYTLSASFGVRVSKIVGGSSSYTLQARLQSAPVLTWRIDGVMLSTTPATVATLQPYSTTIPHMLAFQVPYTHAAGLVTTIVEVTAIAN